MSTQTKAEKMKCLIEVIYDSAQDTSPVELRLNRVIDGTIYKESITILDCAPRILTDALAEAESLGLYANAGDGGVIIG